MLGSSSLWGIELAMCGARSCSGTTLHAQWSVQCASMQMDGVSGRPSPELPKRFGDLHALDSLAEDCVEGLASRCDVDNFLAFLQHLSPRDESQTLRAHAHI
eukprot:1896284-Pyramimonas_sp.AAC.1